jgi:hypothetical protein
MEFHINHGDARFGLIAEMQETASIVRDFNGDGRAEIVRAIDETKVELLDLHDDAFVAQRELTWPRRHPLVQDQSFTFGDFDGDGVMDLVFCGGHLFAVFGEWDGDLADGVYLLPPEEAVSCSGGFFTADLNGDGKSELVVHSRKNLEIFAGERLQRRITIPTGFSLARSRYWWVQALQVDERGGMALVTWNVEDVPIGEPPNVLRVHAFAVSPDDGSFSWSIELHPEVDEVVVADVDGNGLDDLVLVDGRRSKVLLSHPGAPLSQERDAPFIRSSTDAVLFLTAAHLNDDGIHDFVMYTVDGTRTLLSNP